MLTQPLLLLLSTLVHLAFCQTAPLCNGFASLCSKQINQMLFPGTHNSYALAGSTAIPALAANQNAGWTVANQLTDGIRYIDLELWRPVGSNIIHLCHGGCGIFDAGLLTDTLSSVAAFVQTHPREFVFLSFKNNAKATAAELNGLLAALIPFVFVPPSASTTGWPTLGSLLDRSKRLICFQDTSIATDQATPWLLTFGDYLNQNSYQTFDPADFDCVNATAPAKAFTLINHQLGVTVLGSTEIYYPNYQQVPITNSKTSLSAHITKCSVASGFMLVDFGQIGDILQTVGSVNGVSIATNLVTAATPTKPSNSGGEVISVGLAWLVSLLFV